MNEQAKSQQPKSGKDSRGWAVFLRFFFVSAALSDTGGFVICWVMAVRGVASHKPSAGKRQRALALDAGTKGFIGFGYKTKSTGFIGCAVFKVFLCVSVIIRHRRIWPLTLAQRVFLVFVKKIKPQGLSTVPPIACELARKADDDYFPQISKNSTKSHISHRLS